MSSSSSDESLLITFQGQLSACQDDVDAAVLDRLREPINEIIVHFPVRLSDGSTKYFKGYRVQHSMARGPAKGGLRFDPIVHLDECKALAGYMTIKCSLQKLPFGGGKGGVKFNPREFLPEDVDAIARGFCYAIHDYIGGNKDVPAPDVGSNSRLMDVMTKAYNERTTLRDRAVFTGKSVGFDGSEGREEATGRGVMICVQEYAAHHKLNLQGMTYIVQGFGNVGSAVARLLAPLGMVCVGAGDHTGYLRSDEGLNVHKLSEHVRNTGGVRGYGNPNIALEGGADAFFSIPCDVVIPAALEHQLTQSIAKDRLACRVVVEAANGPTTLDAEEALRERGIPVLPDVLCNSGGVVVSYYEWLQNRRDERWEKTYVEQQLDTAMRTTFREVCELAKDKHITYRKAAFLLAIGRIAPHL